VTVLYVVGFLVRDGGGTAAVAWGPLALSAVALAGLLVSGYLGGELAYRYGVRVADEVTQEHGYTKNTVEEERV
jgi:uncharacterized membrane protein